MTKPIKHNAPMNAAQLARMLGVSDEAVYKRIRAGTLQARRVGRTYVIDHEQVLRILGETLSEDRKRQIDASVKKIVQQYGETLRLLGRE